MVEMLFNPEEYESLGSFEPLPVGEYTVVIESSEKRDANTGKGSYYQFVYNVIEGEYQGRKIFDRLNVENESQQAQTIARRALATICRAVGVMSPNDTTELHDKPFVVRVGIRPPKGEYGPSNKINEYKALASAGDSKSKKKVESTEKAETKPAAETKKKMPWQKK